MDTKPTQSLLFAVVCSSLLVSFLATPASAQTEPFKHVIVIVQENRTPDNLFQDQHLIDNGADILPGDGLNNAQQNASCEYGNVYLYAYPSLGACFDPDHLHGTAFETSADIDNNGVPHWDGACSTNFVIVHKSCFPGNQGYGNYANYTYVQNYPVSGSSCPCILNPYYQIAEQYGFANHMFQTNQGPSYAAHQFLFSGTSAPVAYDGSGDTSKNYEMFDSENPFTGNSDNDHDLTDINNYAGCTSYWHSYNPNNGKYYWTLEADILSADISGVGNAGQENFFYAPPNTDYTGFPCYDHPSLATLLDNVTPNQIHWKYYIQSSMEDNRIWAAPNSLSQICPVYPNGSCPNNTDWQYVDDTMGDILNDIHNCNLQQVSWVIPDGSWSDHPGEGPGANDGGPSWVAAIVNAIGGKNQYAPATTCASNNNQAMYWNGTDPTLILVTWDDWGGWYDHITPWLPTELGLEGGYANPDTAEDAVDGAYYVYGFRVPLLVVSTYNNHCPPNTCPDGFTGYISGPTNANHQTVNEDPPYVHDFGSILGFIEWNFGLSPYPNPPSDGCGIAGADSTNFPNGCDYEFADWFAPDGYWECHNTGNNCTWGSGMAYPLKDFFNFNALPYGFTQITGAKYAPSCFVTDFLTTPCFGLTFIASDPDDDVVEAEQ